MLNDYLYAVWFVAHAAKRRAEHRPYSESDHQSLMGDLVEVCALEALLHLRFGEMGKS